MSDIFKDHSFGGWLRTFRLKRQVSLREMSRRLKMDSGNYSKIEMSKLSPPNSIKKLQLLTKPLSLSATEFELLLSTAMSWHMSRCQKRFEV